MKRIARLGCCWLVYIGLLISAVSTSAQPIDLRVQRDPAVEDYDFAWVYWFETHGQGYLREAMGERALPWDTPASRRWRGDALKALVKLLKDKDDGVRASAVIALARMGHEPLLDLVLPKEEAATPRVDFEPGDDEDAQQAEPEPALLLDASDEVRWSAWIALGLLDTRSAQAALAAPPLEDADEFERAAPALAIGLLKSPSEAHLRWLVDRLDDPKQTFEVKRWCLWALRQHDDPALDGVYDAALARLPSTFVLNELLLNRGYIERSGGAQRLVAVLRYLPEVRGWPGYIALSAMPEGGVYGSTPRRLAMETRIAATLTLARLPVPRDAEDQRELLDQLQRRIVAGNSTQAMDFNRGFDLITYVMHCDAREQDLELLYDQMRGLTVYALDDPAVQEGLEEGEAPRAEGLVFRQPDNAVRGYAALATGLLIRRATQGTALYRDRPIVGRDASEIERLKRRFGIRLMRAVADEDEPVSYRAACALALGLTGDTRYKAELAVELGRLRSGDEAVLGYGLLALAMLGDERAAEPARRYVTRPGEVTSNDDRLGRRAALQAVALIGERGGEDTDQLLAGAWGQQPWLCLNTAQATAWSGRYPALPAMLESARSTDPKCRRVAAWSLGRVFENAYPSRLSPISEAINATLSHRPDPAGPAGSGPIGPAPGAPPLEPAGWPTRRFNALIDPGLYELQWP